MSLPLCKSSAMRQRSLVAHYSFDRAQFDFLRRDENVREPRHFNRELSLHSEKSVNGYRWRR
jgi:hypothetical protein